MSSASSDTGDTKLVVPPDLRREWKRVDSTFNRLVYIPRFLVFTGRQISRLSPDATGNDLPGVVLSSLCENVRRSGTYQAALYFGGRNLYPRELEGVKELKIRHMVRWFRLIEIQSILLIIYFNRYLEARCPEDTWSRMIPLLCRDVAIGRKIGLSWKEISPGRGMLLAGLRRISQGFLYLINKKKTAIAKLNNLGLDAEPYSDVERERALCGFSHLTLTAYLAQKCGLGVPLTASFTPFHGDASKMNGDEKIWRATRYFLEQVKYGTPSFELAQMSNFTETEERATIDDYYKSIKSNKGVFSWLNSQKEDVHRIMDHTILG